MENLKKASNELRKIKQMILKYDKESKEVESLEKHCNYVYLTETKMDLYRKKRDTLYEELEKVFKSNIDKIENFLQENEIVQDGSLIFDYYSI